MYGRGDRAVDDEKAGRQVRQWTSKRKNVDLRLDALLDIRCSLTWVGEPCHTCLLEKCGASRADDHEPSILTSILIGLL